MSIRIAQREQPSSVKNKGGVSGGFYIRQEEPSYATEEHGKFHQQSTYGTRQVTTEPKAQENCQLQQRRVESAVAPLLERESDTGGQ